MQFYNGNIYQLSRIISLSLPGWCGGRSALSDHLHLLTHLVICKPLGNPVPVLGIVITTRPVTKLGTRNTTDVVGSVVTIPPRNNTVTIPVHHLTEGIHAVGTHTDGNRFVKGIRCYNGVVNLRTNIHVWKDSPHHSHAFLLGKGVLGFVTAGFVTTLTHINYGGLVLGTSKINHITQYLFVTPGKWLITTQSK